MLPSGLYQYDMLEQRIRSVSTEVMEKEVDQAIESEDWTMPKISISLTEQEELLLAARELVMSTMDLTTQLQELVRKSARSL